MSPRSEPHLNVNLLHAGIYPSAWRLTVAAGRRSSIAGLLG